MALALFVMGLDAGVVNVILPELQSVFETTVSRAMMLATVYMTAMAAFQLTFGRLADLIDPVAVFLGGVTCFFLGSLGCVLSGSITHLLIGRGVQGLGGAMLGASFGAIVLRMMPREKTGGIIGLMTMVMSLGSVVGPPLGGFLTQHLSWHWVFAINLPICLLAAIPLVLILRRGGSGQQTRPIAVRGRLDPVGSGLSVVMFASLPLAFSLAGREGWSSGTVQALAGLFVLSAVLFVLQQRRTDSPLIRLSLLADQRVALIVGIKVFGLMALNAVMLVYPFFMTQKLGLAVSGTGLMMLACAVSMALLTPFSGKMTDRFGSVRILVGGGLVLLATSAAAMTLAPHFGRAMTFFSLATFGVSFAGLTISSTVYLLKLAQKGEEGVFSALNSLLMPVAGSLGLAVFSYLYSARALGPASADTSLAGFQTSMAGIAVCAVLLLTSVKFLKSKEGEQTRERMGEVIKQEDNHG